MFLKCFNQIMFHNILKTRCICWYFKGMYIDSTCTVKNLKKNTYSLVQVDNSDLVSKRAWNIQRVFVALLCRVCF